MSDAESVGRIGLDLVLNSDAFNRQMQGLAKKAGIALAAAFSVKSLVNFSKKCLELGSDLSEVQNVVDVTFTTMSDKVNEFAKSSAKSFGMSETMAKKYTGTFGAMAKAFGFTESQAYDMSTALTLLAGDVASFYNLSQDEAYTKLKSVFTGETESLKDLGVVMTQTALDAYALANGFGKTTAKMSEQEKVALRYKFVQDQLKASTGDFIRTQDGWANQTRILSLQIDSLKANIGQGLINVLSPAIKAINKFVEKLILASDAFRKFTDTLMGKTTSDSGNITSTLGSVTDEATEAADATKSIGDAAVEAAKKANRSLMGFDKINKISSDSGSTSTSSSGSGGTGSSTDTAIKEGDISPVVSKASDKLDKLKSKLQELKKEFAAGFKIGLGNTIPNLKKIRSNISGIKESLLDIAKDKNVKNSISGWLNSEAKKLGTIAGSAVNIGTALSTNIVTGINNGLSTRKNALKERIAKLFDIKSEENDIISNLTASIADIASSVLTSREATGITSSLTEILINAFSTLGVVGAGLTRDYIKVIAEPVIENKNKIKKAIIGTLKPYSAAAGVVSRTFTKVTNTIIKIYENKISPAFEDIKDSISSVLSTFLDAYTKYILPVIEKLGKKISRLIEKEIGPCLEEVFKLIGNIISIIAKLIKYALSPVVNFIIKSVMPVLAKLIEIGGTQLIKIISNVVKEIRLKLAIINALLDHIDIKKILKIATNMYHAFIKPFKSIAKWFKTTFKKAWIAIKDVFNTGNIKTYFKNIHSSVKNIFAGIPKWFKEKFKKSWDNIKTAFDNTKDYFCKVRDRIKAPFLTIHAWFKEKFYSVWEKIRNAFENTKDYFCKVRDRIKAPFLTIHAWFKEKFHSVWEKIRNAFANVKNFFSNVSDKVKHPFEEIHTWFSEKFDNAWGKIKEKFSIETVKTHFKSVLDEIKAPFNGIADWFKATFEDAWGKVKDVFSTGGKIFAGIKEGIEDTFKTVVNKLIDGINIVISKPFEKINEMLNIIRNAHVAGYAPFQSLWEENPLTVPRIPKLANGGFVKANTPQLAVIGDNRHQGEVVAPENKLLEMARQAAEMSGNNDELIKILKRILEAIDNLEVNVQVVGELKELFKAIQKESADYTRRTGKKAFT